MFPRLSSLRPLVSAGLAFAAVGEAAAQLAAKSPFMPPAATATNAPTAGAPLEFRGYIETGDGVQFRVFDPAKKMGTWVKLNERNTDLEILAKKYDSASKTLVIEHQGRTLTLAEKEAKVVSSGTAAQMAPPPPAPPPPSNVPAAVTQAVVLNPTPADEQRRLEAVAAEVARAGDPANQPGRAAAQLASSGHAASAAAQFSAARESNRSRARCADPATLAGGDAYFRV